ncbi:MAG: hypothetical protein WC980_06325 [Candidatus Brocadiia bacterium]
MKITRTISLVSALIIVLTLGSSLSYAAEDFGDTSSGSFLKKYTLSEFFELGVETAFIMPSSARTSNMGNVYVSLSHTIQEYSTFRMRAGYLSGDFTVNNQRTGRFYFTTLDASWIVSLKPGNIRPYYGGTLAYHFFEDFRPMRLVYRDYEAENSFGWGLLGGVKYIVAPMGVSLSADAAYNWTKTFRFYNSKLGLVNTPKVYRIDFSGLYFSVNAALHF